MAGSTAILGVSVSPRLARGDERVAEREGTMKRDLFLCMVTIFKADCEEQSSSRFSES